MAIVGFKEVTERARLGDLSAINALIESIVQVGTDGENCIDLDNAEWEVDPEPKTAGEVAGDHLRQLRDQAIALEAERDELKVKLRSAASDYHSLTESITERLKEAVVAGELDMANAKTIANDLGAAEPEWDWTVTVDVQIVINGVQGEEDEVEQKVRDNVSIDVATGDLGEDASEEINITGVDVTSEDN